MSRRLLALLLACFLVLAACGDDGGSDEQPDDPDVETDGDVGDDQEVETGDEDASGDEETSAPEPGAEDDPCRNDVEIVNAAAEELDGLSDGPVDVVWTLSEGAPHPDNTVDDDQNATLAFASYDIPDDGQFGPSIPVGDPGAPEGGLIVIISLFNPDGPIDVGQTYLDQIDFDDDPSISDGKINFYAASFGPDRLLPGDVLVEITDITDELICFELSSVTETDLQTFVGLEGSVAVDRQQYLRSLDDE